MREGLRPSRSWVVLFLFCFSLWARGTKAAALHTCAFVVFVSLAPSSLEGLPDFRRGRSDPAGPARRPVGFRCRSATARVAGRCAGSLGGCCPHGHQQGFEVFERNPFWLKFVLLFRYSAIFVVPSATPSPLRELCNYWLKVLCARSK